MKINNITIFTSNSVTKLHPRIEMQVSILSKHNICCRVEKTNKKRDNYLWEILNIFCFKYFKWGSINEFKKKIEYNNIVWIYDLTLLPLCKFAKRKNCKVIYETLDDNIFLVFHAIQKKIPFLRIFKKIITYIFTKYEGYLTKKYCDCIIVNSPNLLDKYTNKNIHLLYYTSHLESIKVNKYDSKKETILLYMGLLDTDKGAFFYKRIIQKYGIRMLFYGNTNEKEVKKWLNGESHVIRKGNLSMEKLIINIKEDIMCYNLIGLSIINAVNKSYELQEANKEIDYMAMGIPFIGNYRKPTYNKIIKGIGILYNDEKKIINLINNYNNCYDKASRNAVNEYKIYCQESFESKLLNILGKFAKI